MEKILHDLSASLPPLHQTFFNVVDATLKIIEKDIESTWRRKISKIFKTKENGKESSVLQL